MIDNDILEILACPAGKGRLKESKARLVCLRCRRAYPVREGIPILLTEEGKIEKKD